MAVINTNKFVSLEANTEDTFNNTLWHEAISGFLIDYLANKKVSLFELKPTKHSIIYEYDSHQKIKFNGHPAIYINSLILSVDEIKTLAADEDFYLGHLIILTSEIINPRELFNSWAYLKLAGSSYEIITQDSDGKYFHIHNPTVEAENHFYKHFK